MLEGRTLYINSGSSVLAQAGHELLRRCGSVLLGHFDIIVRLNLNQSLFIVEVFEVAVVEVESGRMSPIAMHRVKGIQVEQNLVPLAVMLDHWEERFLVLSVFNDYENCV